MNFKTPTAIAVGVVSALAGVAGAAIALPSSPPAPAATTVATATPTAEVRTKTVRRTIHVVKRDRPAAPSSGTPAAAASTATPVRTVAATNQRSGPALTRVDDSGHHGRGSDDSGADDSGHHGGGDDGGGSGRGRGGDDD
jgi:uncharacterized membrane protein YgcG